MDIKIMRDTFWSLLDPLFLRVTFSDTDAYPLLVWCDYSYFDIPKLALIFFSESKCGLKVQFFLIERRKMTRDTLTIIPFPYATYFGSVNLHALPHPEPQSCQWNICLLKMLLETKKIFSKY